MAIRKWYVKACAVALMAFMVFATGCSSESANSTASAESAETESVEKKAPIEVTDLKLETATVGNTSVFWFENNSEYTITAVRYSKIIPSTNEAISATAGWGNNTEKGGISDKGEFEKELEFDENYELIEKDLNVSEAELAESQDLTLEIEYLDEYGRNVGIEYDFITKGYSLY